MLSEIRMVECTGVPAGEGHTRGEAGPDSDVGLLVIMDCKGSKRQRQLAIRLALHEVRIAKDIIVTTPEELAWRKEIPGTIEGKVLYAGP